MIFSGNTYQPIYTQTGKFVLDINFNIHSTGDIKIILGENETGSSKDLFLNLTKGKIFDAQNDFIGSYQIRNDHNISILSDGEKYDLYLDGKETVFNIPNSGYYYNYFGVNTSESGELHFDFSGESVGIILSENNIMKDDGSLNVLFYLNPIIENRNLTIFDVEAGTENNLSGAYFSNFVDSSGMLLFNGNPNMSGDFYQSLIFDTSVGQIETGFWYSRTDLTSSSSIDLFAYDTQTDFYLFNQDSISQIYVATIDGNRDYSTFDFKLESTQYRNPALETTSGKYNLRLVDTTGVGSGFLYGTLQSGSGELTGLWKGYLYYSGNEQSIISKYVEIPISKTVVEVYSGILSLDDVIFSGYAYYNTLNNGTGSIQTILSNRRFKGEIEIEPGEFPILVVEDYNNLFTGQDIGDYSPIYGYNPSKILPAYSFVYKNGYEIKGFWTGTINEDDVENAYATFPIYSEFLDYYSGYYNVLNGYAYFSGRNSNQMTEVTEALSSAASGYIRIYNYAVSFPQDFRYTFSYNPIGNQDPLMFPSSYELSGIIQDQKILNLATVLDNENPLIGLDTGNLIWSGMLFKENISGMNLFDGEFSGNINNIPISKRDVVYIYELFPIENIENSDNYLYGYIEATGIVSGYAEGYLINESGWISGSNASGYLQYMINGNTYNQFVEDCDISGYVTNIETFTGVTGETGIIFTSTGFFSGSAYGYANFIGVFNSGTAFENPPILDEGYNAVYIELDRDGARESGNGLVSFAYKTKITGMTSFPLTTKVLNVSYCPYTTTNSISYPLFNYIDPEPPSYYREFIDINGNTIYTEYDWQAVQFDVLEQALNPIISGMQLSGINKKWIFSGDRNIIYNGEYYDFKSLLLKYTSELYPPYAAANNSKGTAIVANLPARADNINLIDPGQSIDFLQSLPIDKWIQSTSFPNNIIYYSASGKFPNQYVKAVPQTLTDRLFYLITGQGLEGSLPTTGFFTGIVGTYVSFNGVNGEAFGKWGNSLYAYYKPFSSAYHGTVRVDIDFGTGKYLTGYFPFDLEMYERQKGYPWYYDDNANVPHPSWVDISINAIDYFSTSPWDNKIKLIGYGETVQGYDIPLTTTQVSYDNKNFKVTFTTGNYKIKTSDLNYGDNDVSQDKITFYSEYLINKNIKKEIYAITGYKDFFNIWDLQTGYDINNFSQKFSFLGWSGINGTNEFYSDNNSYNNSGDTKGSKNLYAKVTYTNSSQGTSDYAKLIFSDGVSSEYIDIYGYRELE